MRFTPVFLAVLTCLFLTASRNACGFRFTPSYRVVVAGKTLQLMGLISTNYTFDNSWDHFATVDALHTQFMAARALDFALNEYFKRFSNNPKKKEFYQRMQTEIIVRVKDTGLALQNGSKMAIAFSGNSFDEPIGTLIRTYGRAKDLLRNELELGNLALADTMLNEHWQAFLNTDAGKIGLFVVKRGHERYVAPLLGNFLAKFTRKDVDSVLVCWKGKCPDGMEEYYEELGAKTIAYLGREHAAMMIPRDDISISIDLFRDRAAYRQFIAEGQVFSVTNWVSSKLSASQKLFFSCASRLIVDQPITDAFLEWVKENHPDYF